MNENENERERNVFESFFSILFFEYNRSIDEHTHTQHTHNFKGSQTALIEKKIERARKIEIKSFKIYDDDDDDVGIHNNNNNNDKVMKNKTEKK